MWEGWKCNEDTASNKGFELMVKSHPKTARPDILLTVTINPTGSAPLPWTARILSFAPSAGDYVLFEDRFASIQEAEKIIWEKADEISRGHLQQR
jgi:hypothetical protein